MEDITSLFYSIQQDNPHYGSYICLLEAIKGMGFRRKACEFYFKELVERDDYSKADKETLINGLVEVSNGRS